MATTDKKKRDPQFTSPIGTFKFPALDTPSYGSKDYPKPDGEYKVKLLMAQSDPATKAFIASLSGAYADAQADGEQQFAALPVATRKQLGKLKMHPMFALVYDKETEEPTGDIEFNFKLKASGIYKNGPKKGHEWHARPVLFDAKGKRLDNPPPIWGGTRGRISFSAGSFFVAGTGTAGLSLRLLGAQIIDLVSKGERTAESLGFGAVEGGFDADDLPKATNDNDAKGETNATDIDDEIAF